MQAPLPESAAGRESPKEAAVSKQPQTEEPGNGTESPSVKECQSGLVLEKAESQTQPAAEEANEHTQAEQDGIMLRPDSPDTEVHSTDVDLEFDDALDSQPFSSAQGTPALPSLDIDSRSEPELPREQSPQLQAAAVPDTALDATVDADADDFDEFGDFGDFDGADDFEETPDAEDTVPEDSSSTEPPFSVQIPNFTENFSHTFDSTPSRLDPYMGCVFPLARDYTCNGKHNQGDAILSDRSASLWQELYTAPTVAFPGWESSQLRRLYLMSLGVSTDQTVKTPPQPAASASAKEGASTQPPTTEVQHPPSREEALATRRSVSQDIKQLSKPSIGSSDVLAPAEVTVPGVDSDLLARLGSITVKEMEDYSNAELSEFVESLSSAITKVTNETEFWESQNQRAEEDSKALEELIGNLIQQVEKMRR